VRLVLSQRSIVLLSCLVVGIVLISFTYYFVKKEVILYENPDIDGYGFKAMVTCRPDALFTYYPYLVIESSRGVEVARSQINNRGYEAAQACRVSFPVERVEAIPGERVVRLHFNGRNVFGDLETFDVPVRYFSY
jgi:hypothetical protein